jgi:hypothetical protein
MKQHLTGPEQAVFDPEIVQLMSGALEDACQFSRGNTSGWWYRVIMAVSKPRQGSADWSA